MEREQLIRTVEAAKNGDEKALNTLFNTYYNDVYYFALKTVKDADLACDITQETFVEILNTLGNLEEPAAFVSWMKKITYHQCTRYFKKKKEILVDEDEEGNTVFDTLPEEREEFIPGEGLDREDFRKTILSMIDRLSDEQRAAVMMFYFDELSVKQIADIQGVSEGTIKSRLNYARKSIKVSVEEYEKKNNIKLHSLGVAPLLLWLFRDSFAKPMSAASAKAVAAGVSAATGAKISISAASASLLAKVVAGLIAVALVVGGGVAIGQHLGAGESNQPTEPQTPHTHSYSEEVTKAATCTEEGVKTFTCSCGETYTEILTATGHTLGEWEIYIQSTDHTPGENRKNCANCDYYESKMQYFRLLYHCWNVAPGPFESVEDLGNDDYLSGIINAAWVSDEVEYETTYNDDGMYYRTIPVPQLDVFTSRHFGITLDYTGISGMSFGYESRCDYDAETNSVVISGMAGIGGGGYWETSYEYTQHTEDNIHFTFGVTETNTSYESDHYMIYEYTAYIEKTPEGYILTRVTLDHYYDSYYENP